MTEMRNGRVSDDVRGLCICRDCPSYTECMRAEDGIVFCLEGTSADCMFDPVGCSCPECPVQLRLGLTRSQYCIRGPENEQR